MRKFIVLLFLATAAAVFGADVIPAARRGLWTGGVVGVPGGVEQYRNGGAFQRGAAGGFATIDVTQSPYFADNTGVANASSAVQAACDAAVPGDVVYLPAGTYRFNFGIGPSSASQADGWSGITIRGDGPTNTIINSYVSGSGAAISLFVTANDDLNFPNPRVAITGSPTRGTTTLAIADTSLIEGYEGYIFQVLLDNSYEADMPVISTRGYPQVRTFGGRIVSVNPGVSVTISPAAQFDLPASLNPVFARLTRFSSLVGIEDLSVDATNSPGNASPTINFGQTIDCWMYNVASYNSPNYLAALQIAVNCTIQHSDFRTRIGGGTSGAGILTSRATNCLVTDSIIDEIFPSIEVNFASGNNIFSYNFFAGSSNGGQIGASLLSNHGAYNSFNLAEGNFGPVVQSDGYFGGEAMLTVFRNVWTGYDGPANTAGRWPVRFNRFSRYFNLVANVVGKTGESITWQYANAGPEFQTTTATSTTVVSTGFLPTLTIADSGKAFENGTPILMISRGTPSAFMSGWVSGDPAGGTSVDVQVFRSGGSGTYSDWDIIGVNGFGNPILYAFGSPLIGNGGTSAGAESVVAMPSRGVWWWPWDGTPFNRLSGPGPDPFFSQTVTGIIRSGTTATATTATDHGLLIGVGFPGYVDGADQAEYNGNATITAINATQFTYTVSGSPATPATGSSMSAVMRYNVGDVVDFQTLGQEQFSGSDTIFSWQAVNAAKNGLPTWETPSSAQSDWYPISQLSFQDRDADVFETLIFYGNATPNGGDNGYEIVASQALPGGDTYPDSYYLASKPAWFGTLTWPPVDPTNPSADPTRIPAGWRYTYNNENYLNGNSTANITTLNVGTINKVP